MRIMTSKELDEMVFMHHGHDQIQKQLFVGPTNIPFMSKPRGCFWGSPYTPKGEYRSPWEEFFVDGFSASIVERFAKCELKFKIKPEAKILILDNVEDVEKLKEKYMWSEDSRLEALGILKDDNFLRDFSSWVILDWEKIAKDYDGAYFTDNASNELYHVLYTWDIESVCLFNLDHVEQI